MHIKNPTHRVEIANYNHAFDPAGNKWREKDPNNMYRSYILPGEECIMLGTWTPSGICNTADADWEFGELTDMAGATDMMNFFEECKSFTGRQGNTANILENWDVSSVTNMHHMFRNCHKFNLDLSKWCVQHIDSEPFDFSAGCNPPFGVWTLPKPPWGKCP
jgi:hypothetical protein